MRRSHEAEDTQHYTGRVFGNLTLLSAMIRTRRRAKNEISAVAYVVVIVDTISILRLPILSSRNKIARTRDILAFVTGYCFFNKCRTVPNNRIIQYEIHN